MIVQETTNSQFRSSGTKESNFVIKTSAASFQILSNGLYSNKVRSILRELGSNATDIHIQTGQADRPWDLHLPTMYEPYLKIRDYGTGLSEEEIVGYEENGEWVPGIYSSYFHSTKRDTNSQIGSYGLGSKTPFALVSSFLVESFQNGAKKSYTCFLNEEHIPTVALFSTEETTEENGLAVSFQTTDYHRFKDESKHAFRYFNPIPKRNIEHVVIEPPKYAVEGKGWGYVGYGNAQVIQGPVAYPISADDRKHFDPDVQWLLHHWIDIFVDIGDVSPAPSREVLQFNAHTTENLNAKLKAIADDIKNTIEVELSQAKSKLDRLKRADKLRQTGGLFAHHPLISSIPKTVTFCPPNYLMVRATLYKPTAKSGTSFSPSKVDTTVSIHTVLAYDDIGVGSSAAIHSVGNKRKHNLLVFRWKKSDHAAAMAEIDDFNKTAFDGLEIVKLSSLVPKPTQKVRLPTPRNKWFFKASSSHATTSVPDDIEVEYYVIRDRENIVSPSPYIAHAIMGRHDIKYVAALTRVEAKKTKLKPLMEAVAISNKELDNIAKVKMYRKHFHNCYILDALGISRDSVYEALDTLATMKYQYEYNAYAIQHRKQLNDLIAKKPLLPYLGSSVPLNLIKQYLGD